MSNRHLLNGQDSSKVLETIYNWFLVDVSCKGHDEIQSDIRNEFYTNMPSNNNSDRYVDA